MQRKIRIRICIIVFLIYIFLFVAIGPIKANTISVHKILFTSFWCLNLLNQGRGLQSHGTGQFKNLLSTDAKREDTEMCTGSGRKK